MFKKLCIFVISIKIPKSSKSQETHTGIMESWHLVQASERNFASLSIFWIKTDPKILRPTLLNCRLKSLMKIFSQSVAFLCSLVNLVRFELTPPGWRQFIVTPERIITYFSFVFYHHNLTTVEVSRREVARVQDHHHFGQVIGLQADLALQLWLAGHFDEVICCWDVACLARAEIMPIRNWNLAKLL